MGRILTADRSRPPVWITRSDQSAPQSAAAFTAAGFTPITAPLLSIAATATAADAPDDDAVLAFTSPNGVSAFAALSDRRHYMIYAVGDATAERAKALGFRYMASAHGDVNALAALILKDKPSKVVHYSGVHVAGDLVGDLTAAGLSAQRRIIYGARAVTEIPQAAAEALSTHKTLIAVLYSPKGARAFLDVMQRAGQTARYSDMILMSLSQNVDACLGEHAFAARLVAASPDEPSLIAGLISALERRV